MNSISDAAKNDNQQAQLSLIRLSEFAIVDSPENIFALLAENGCVVISSSEPWRTLSGGLEYNQCLVEPITVDAIVSRLIIEVTRAQDPPENSWVNGFELQPTDLSQNDWLDKVSVVLARDFEAEGSNETGVERFSRGATQCLLVRGLAIGRARLLLHRRMDIDASLNDR